jgi:molecular chaperone DnaK
MISETNEPAAANVAIGIDLGTTFSAVACIDQHGSQQIIPNRDNERLTPSVILFDGRSAIVGAVARQNAMSEPEKIVDYVKREMGKGVDQFHREFDGHKYSAEELSALILKKLKGDAEYFLQQPVTEAVITVPAYFNDAERTATIHAGQLAGLNVLNVINEPTAAALAYGFQNLQTKQTIFVFDLGGGTFDVTIMRVENEEIRMLASNGDHRLGGKDWDDVITTWAAEEFDKQFGEDPLFDLASYQELHSRSVAAKIQLTNREKTTLVHSYNGNSVKLEVTREEFEHRARHLRDRCKMISEIVLEEAQLRPVDLDCILLVGGMTRMPSILEMLRQLAPGVRLAEFANPDEVVARGTALQASLLMLQKASQGERAPLPASLREQFLTSRGELIKVTNIATHTLGVVLWDQASGQAVVSPMIRRGSTMPASATRTFAISKDDLDRIAIDVMEGESTVPGDCTPLGTCEVLLPARMAKGTPVSLTYRYTEDQVLEVLTQVGEEISHASIRRATGLSQEELASAREGFSSISVT